MTLKITMSAPTPRFLLDKNVIRKVIVGLGRLAAPLPEEALCLEFWRQAELTGAMLLISAEAAHILAHYERRSEVQTLLASVSILQRGRYFKRWARRLRQHGFAREDAKVLALGTFGADAAGRFVGVDAVATLDRPFANLRRGLAAVLERHLAAMIEQLAPPYCKARLPQVEHPIILLPGLIQKEKNK